MNWNPAYALLMLFSTLITFVCGLLMESEGRSIVFRKLCLTISILVNFGILFFFKYFNFLNESILMVLNTLRISCEVPDLDILLPVGISFYTFQAVGYTIDVYKRDIVVEKHFGIYALFISFFPQLVAGPIERAKHLMPQFRVQRSFDASRMSAGLKLILWGLFIKVAIADRAGVYVDAVYNNAISHSGTSLALATLLFSIQIYCDFAGYSTIAVGTAKVLGFDLMCNFKRPYLATSITEFWRRWHISLSTWFKDYLYFPLGGNRRGTFRNYINILVTFVVSGLWHGASWTFVFWGLIHGVAQVIEKACFKARIGWGSIQNSLHYLLTIAFVMVAWIFFRASSVSESFLIVGKIFTNIGSQLFIDKTTFFYLLISLPILALVEVVEEFFPKSKKLFQVKVFRYPAYVFLFLWIMLIGVFNGSQFIYFQF